MQEKVSNNDLEDPVNSPLKKKNKSQGPKADGVKRLMVLFMGEKIPENYANVKKIIDCLGLRDYASLDTTFSSDLKLINILLGMQAHSCAHACAYCNIRTRGEGAYDETLRQIQTRTFGSLQTDYNNFVVNGSKIKDAKKYYNVVHEQMLKPNADDFSLNQPILHKIPPPELHLFEGNMNHIIDALSKKVDDLKEQGRVRKTLYRFLWEPPICIVKKDYHGGKLNGPNCNKILEDNVLQQLADFLPQEEEFQQYVVTLKAMKNLKKSCFSSKKLDTSIGASFEYKWKEHHQKFVDAYSGLNLGKFPKFHIVETHVPEFITWQAHGLGRYSEVFF